MGTAVHVAYLPDTFVIRPTESVVIRQRRSWDENSRHWSLYRCERTLINFFLTSSDHKKSLLLNFKSQNTKKSHVWTRMLQLRWLCVLLLSLMFFHPFYLPHFILPIFIFQGGFFLDVSFFPRKLLLQSLLP